MWVGQEAPTSEQWCRGMHEVRATHRKVKLHTAHMGEITCKTLERHTARLWQLRPLERMVNKQDWGCCNTQMPNSWRCLLVKDHASVAKDWQESMWVWGPECLLICSTSRDRFMLQTSWALHSCLLIACRAFILALPCMLIIYFDHMHPLYYSSLSTLPIWRHLSRSQASGFVSIEIPQGGRCT